MNYRQIIFFLHSAIDISLHDNESNNLDISSIYSADISLKDYESNNSDISSIYSANISLEDYESNNSESISDMSLNEDIMNNTNKSTDFGKFFNLFIYYII